MTIALDILGGLGFLVGVRFYIELRKWRRYAQSRIVIAYNRRPQINEPIYEWIVWLNQLGKDKQANGHTVYRNGKVSVSIIKATLPPGRIRTAIAKRKRRKLPAREGKAELA